MRKIIIDYLTDLDKQQPAYKSSLKEMEGFEVLFCEDLNELRGIFLQLNTNKHELIVTFLSHGCELDLVKKIGDSTASLNSLISWNDLLAVIGGSRTTHRLVLNLAATCSSINIQKDSIINRNRIDEIWVTKTETHSIMKAIVAMKYNNLFFLNDEDEVNYVVL